MAARAALREHLLSWTAAVPRPKLEQVAPPAYRALGGLLVREALAAEAARSGRSALAPLAHREAPPLEPPAEAGGAAFLEQLLAPVRTGFVLVRDDLVARRARARARRCASAERRYVLEALLSQDAPGDARAGSRRTPARWRGRDTRRSSGAARAARVARRCSRKPHRRWHMLDEEKLAGLTEEDVRRIVREELERAQKRDPAGKKAAIIASKGTLDWAYPPLILATTAAASGMEAHVFFTFYGLNIIHRDFERKLKVSPIGQPGDADARADAEPRHRAAGDGADGDRG